MLTICSFYVSVRFKERQTEDDFSESNFHVSRFINWISCVHTDFTAIHMGICCACVCVCLCVFFSHQIWKIVCAVFLLSFDVLQFENHFKYPVRYKSITEMLCLFSLHRFEIEKIVFRRHLNTDISDIE